MIKKGDLRLQVREFLQGHLSSQRFADDENIFEAGLVNSLFAVQLVAFVENSLGVKVEDIDLDLANFNSVNAICGFVKQKSTTA
jgi:acyl carrier protein